MVETLSFGIDKMGMWVLSFTGNIILISIFSKKAKLSVKNIVSHMSVIGIIVGLYIVYAKVAEEDFYLYLVLNFIFIHMIFKNKLWEFCLVQSIYYINYTFWWVIFDYIGDKFKSEIIRNYLSPAIAALIVCVILTKVFKSTFFIL